MPSRVRRIGGIVGVHRSMTAWKDKDFHRYSQILPQFLPCGCCQHLLLTISKHEINNPLQRRLGDEINVFERFAVS
jgi:hypothetical protein